MGFGHRVYKVRDPRADVLAAAAERMFTRGGDMSLYTLARAVEATALRLLEEYKPGRRLQTNVEFYTALLLHGLGLDVRAVHADLRDQPRQRLDRARDRAAARQPHHPPAVGVHRPARSEVGADCGEGLRQQATGTTKHTKDTKHTKKKLLSLGILRGSGRDAIWCDERREKKIFFVAFVFRALRG